jgi:TP901 family phage tail tape measure protein
MADVGSLGQYKVVVTADYSQLQTNFKAMADFVTSTTKSMTDSVNQSMSSINATMLKQLQTTVDQLKKSFEGLGDAPKKAGDGFKSYTKQINEATKEMQKAYQEQERMQRELEAIRSRGSSTTVGHLTNNRDEMAMVQAIEQQKAKVAELTANVQRLRQEEERYKNVLNQSDIAAKQRAKDMKQAAKDEQNLMRQNSRILEGEIRSRIQGESQVSRAQQANAVANARRIQQLQTQYRVAYEEVNKYIQANLKMSEAVFIRLQGRLTAFSNELKRLGATPALANPLGNQTYKEYVSQFSKMDDMLKSIRHHLTWMASAVAIGTVFAIPSQTISTIADVEKQMAAMRQVNHDVNTSQEVLNKTTQDFIGIAEQYGHSVDEIIKAGTLWGRGYKDLNTVMKLTSLTAKLAVADNMDIGLANRAVESVIMSYQKQGQAVQFATHVVDSWTKIAHNAQSSATDLAEALSRTGAAAKAVGVDFDTANALASAMIKATGRSGAEVGNALKSLFSSIHSKKALQQLEQLGIEMYKVDADGTKHFRNLHDVFVDLMITSHTTARNMEKDLLAISGGRRKLAA